MKKSGTAAMAVPLPANRLGHCARRSYEGWARMRRRDSVLDENVLRRQPLPIEFLGGILTGLDHHAFQRGTEERSSRSRPGKDLGVKLDVGGRLRRAYPRTRHGRGFPTERELVLQQFMH